MPRADENTSLDRDADPAYLSNIRQHIQHTYAHIIGHHEPQQLPLPPHYTANPPSYWTSSEKHLFFHGLAVHSRLRPDLIAREVGTKGVVDICAYIDLLEDAHQREKGETSSETRRVELECAMDVSDSWIAFEEQNVSRVLASEKSWESIATSNSRATLLKDRKKELVPRGKRTQEGLAAFKTWEKEQKALWEKEDIMGNLGSAHLKVMDGMIRDREEMLALSLSRQNTEELPGPAADEEMTDPLLRSAPSATKSASISETLSPSSRRRLKKRLYMRRKREEAKQAVTSGLPEASTSASAAAATPVPDLIKRVKPGRKSQPRKKRKIESPDPSPSAPLSEDERDSDEESADPRHQHVGGKTLRYKIQSKLLSAGADAEALEKEGLGLFHLGALGQVARMYSLLSVSDPEVDPEEIPISISAATIQFLHAHVVQYLTTLIHRAIISREREKEGKAHTKVWYFNGEHILAATIEHAQKMAGRELETREDFFQGLFERLGVHVEEETVEQEESDETDELGPESEDEDGDMLVNEKLGGDTELAEKNNVVQPLLTLHQQMYTPIVRLLPTQGPSTTPYVYQGHRRTTSLSLEPEDPLLPSDDDDEGEQALAAELRKEAELDRRELAQAEQYERVLWGEFGDLGRSEEKGKGKETRNKPDRDREDHDEADTYAMRFELPAVAGEGGIKSAVYILDSE